MSDVDIEPKRPLTPAVFHMLLALADGPLHGYAIMRSVSRTAGPEVPAGASTVYGSLRRMEVRGLGEETRQPPSRTAGRRRRVYVLTARGRRALGHEAVRLLGIVELLRARGLAPAPTNRFDAGDAIR